MNKRNILLSFVMIIVIATTTGCEFSATTQNTIDTQKVTETLTANQKTPTDIDFSLERYNLIKRAYWVNGQREKANTVPCPIERPIGYIVLLTENGSILNSFTVDGKVSSLNSFLSPDSEYYEAGSVYNDWLADVDGSYGVNVDGIFFFTIDNKYIEWTGEYLYSDIPFTVEQPVLKMEVN